MLYSYLDNELWFDFFFQEQYIFVYQAIMKLSPFGDTELEFTVINPTWKRLSGEDTNSPNSKLVQEFAKLANILDDRKALSVNESK